MRYIRLACIAVFALALVFVAMANKEIVNLALVPGAFSDDFAHAPSIALPLYLVIFGSILIGFLAGWLLEWVREFGLRSTGEKEARERRRLERELKRLQDKSGEGKDEVLAILDGQK